MLYQFGPVAADSAVNRDHPLNRGKVAWWIQAPGVPAGGSRLVDLYGRNHGTLTGFSAGATPWQPSRHPSKFGQLSCATTASKVVFGLTDSVLPNLSAGTIILWQRKQDTTNRISGAFGHTGADNQAASVHLPYSDGNIYFDWGGKASINRLAVSGLSWDMNWHHWAFCVGSGLGVRIYRDGILVGSNTYVITRTTGGTWNLNVYQAIAGDLADIGSVATYNRGLTAAEVLSDYNLSRQGYPGVLNRRSLLTRAVLGTPTFVPPWWQYASQLTIGAA
jgi:hypothetical protein